MERKVGEVFEKDGKKYKAVLQSPENQNTCTGCAFEQELCKSIAITYCSPAFREDGNDVVFVKVPEDTTVIETMPIAADLYRRLCQLGIIPNEVRSGNVGASDYSMHIIQPWAIWQEYGLNPWDADIVKRVLRHKTTDTRRMDYEKIIHICEERIRQIDEETAE